MPTTANEGEKVGILTTLTKLISDKPLAFVCLYLIIRSYQIESNVNKKEEVLNVRAEKSEEFERERLKKKSEQEDRDLKIRETELNILHATDSL